jgi:predicted adenine nucleotide alpha hydrolase (AANH) superfamily ATPase
MKLLLHTCCGPCFLGVWEDLKTSDFEITNFFYNPNIQPVNEYELRLKNLEIAAEGKSQEILAPKYDPNQHLQSIKGKEKDFPKRCLDCYKLRLKETARVAKNQNFDTFSTTLLVSPYQQHEIIKDVGQEVGAQVGIEFYYRDWRPFFREGQKIAKISDIYRQKYCGCIYSKIEAAR